MSVKQKASARIEELLHHAGELFRQGRRQLALERLAPALTLAREHLTPTDSLYGSCVVNLADLHMALGNHQQAEKLVGEYLHLLERAGGRGTAPGRHARNLLANLYVRTHRFAAAEELALAAIASADEDGMDVAAWYLLLITTYVATAQDEKARELLAKLVAIRDALPPGHPNAEELSGCVDSALALVAEARPAPPSASATPPPDDEAFAAGIAECWRLFLDHEFAPAAERALGLLVLRSDIMLIEIRLISLLWTGRSVERDAERALAVVPAGTWERKLIELTLGGAQLSDVIALAPDELALCVSWLFAGILALHRRDDAAAREALEKAAGAYPGSWPARQAALQIEALDFAARSVDALGDEDRARAERCYSAFARHDYLAFSQVAMELQAAGSCPPEICVLQPTALRALGNPGLAADQLRHSRRQLFRFPWHVRMLDLLAGRAPPQVFLDAADDPVHRCQANYYAAVAKRLQGEWAEARMYLQAALAATADCAEKRLAEMEDADTAAALNHLSERTAFLIRTGRLDEAEQAARAAVAYARMHAGARRDLLATALSHGAVVSAERGRLAESLQLFREIEALTPDLPADAAVAHLANLGQIYLKAGAYAEARELLARALERVGDDAAASMRAGLLNAMGLAELGIGGPTTALRFHEEAASEHERTGEAESVERAITEDNAGICLQMLGEHDAAVVRHQRAAEILRGLVARESIPASHPSLEKNLTNLATALLMVGRLPEAERRAREGLTIAPAEAPTALAANVVLSWICWAGGRWAEALECLLRAAEAGDALSGEMMALGSEELRMNYVAMAQLELSMLVTLTGAHLAHDGVSVERVFDVALRRKALTAEAAIVQREAVLQRYPSLRPALQELAQAREVIAATMLADAAGAPRAAVTDLSALRERERRLEEVLAREIPELQLEATLHKVSTRRVAESVPRDWTVVEFMRLPVFDAPSARKRPMFDKFGYWAFVLPAGIDVRPALVDLGSAEDIDTLARAWHDTLASHRRPLAGTAIETAGIRLREVVFDPLADLLPDEGHVVLAPDGALLRIPFETLPQRNGGYLTDRYTFSYVGTGRDLLRVSHGPSAPAGACVVAANPDFDLGEKPLAAAEAKPLFVQLPGTEREGELVGRLLGVEPWMGRAVLKSRLKHVVSPRVLHLATHGFFAADSAEDKTVWHQRLRALMGHFPHLGGPRNPLLQSGLVLAGANTSLAGGTVPTEAGDGLLTAVDVLGMDLSGTELVVLSACETGLGVVHANEGVMGLRRAFLLAGARTVVVSLWPVDDEATCEMMAAFYRKLARGMPRVEALCAAQLALRARHPSPSLWGAFICFGATGPLN